MAAKQHLICLTAEERECVERAVRSNKNSPRERLRARILLTANDEPALGDKQISKAGRHLPEHGGTRAAAFRPARPGGRAPPRRAEAAQGPAAWMDAPRRIWSR